MKKRFLAILLTAAITVSLLPVQSFAGEPDPDPAATVYAGPDVLKSFIQSKSGDPGGYVYLGGRQWNVIGYDGEGAATEKGTATLFSKDLYDSIPYSVEKEATPEYAPSFLHFYLSSRIPDQDRSAIKSRAINGTDTDVPDGITGTTVQQAGLWALSSDEAQKVLQNVRNSPADTSYWLRSPGTNDPTRVTTVNAYGLLQETAIDKMESRGARPALWLDTDDVILVTALVEGADTKPTTVSSALPAVGTEDRRTSDIRWKLTLKDDILNVTADIIQIEGTDLYLALKTPSILHDGYVSAMVKGSDGAVKYYGHVKEDPTGLDTVIISLEGLTLAEGDKLYVFAEVCNGGEAGGEDPTVPTDFAGEPFEIGFPVTNTLTNLTGSNKAALISVLSTAPYTTTLTAEEGYTLPQNISVLIGGEAASSGWSYSPGNGAVSIESSIITGNVEIVAAAVPAVYELTAAPLSLDFGTVATGYVQPEAQTVTLTNSGNMPLRLSKLLVTSDFSVECSSWDLSPEGTMSFTVRPAAGLPAGEYKETLTVSTDSSASAAVELSFTVYSDPINDAEPIPSGRTVGNNNGTVPKNEGTLVNNNSGAVVEENNGSVNNNAGKVTENSAGASVDNNLTGAEIPENYGTVGNNAGTVTENFGSVSNNLTGGTVSHNAGSVINNAGDVTDNIGTVTENLQTGTVANNAGSIINNAGKVTNNLNGGTVDDNSGTVTNNGGQINCNEGSLENNLADGDVSENSGSISSNAGHVGRNSGSISNNLTGAAVDVNDGSITNNAGTVTTNNGSIDENLPGSVVNENNGTINNNKGEVKKNNGTIYEPAEMLAGQEGINGDTGIIILIPSDDPANCPAPAEIERLARLAGGTVITHIVSYVKGSATDVAGEETCIAMTYAEGKWSTTLLGAAEAPFSRKGFALIGWSETEDAETAEYAFGETVETAEGLSLTLYPVFEKQEYKFTAGTGQSYTLKSGKALEFTCDGPFEAFDSALVDGKAIDKANYSVKKGSTVLTLKNTYADTLNPGEHTLQLLYAEGESNTVSFTVKEALPKVGDRSFTGLWTALTLLSAGALFAVNAEGHKKRCRK